MPSQVHPRVMSALVGSPHVVRRHADCPAPITNPRDFAAALGYDVERITKTLLVSSSNGSNTALLIAPAARKVDLHRLARALGCGHLGLVSGVELEHQLGYVRHGVSPLGVSDKAVYMDRSLMKWPTVLVGAGQPGLEIELAPELLWAATGAVLMDLGA